MVSKKKGKDPMSVVLGIGLVFGGFLLGMVVIIPLLLWVLPQDAIK